MEKKLQDYLASINLRIDLPSDINFSINTDAKELILTLSKKGLTDNMQTDSAAFESWAILLKTRLNDVIDKVKITWNVEFDENKDSGKFHYNRVMYRLYKFIRTYPWAYTDKKCLIYPNLACNCPNGNAASREQLKQDTEAIIEYDFVQKHQKDFDYINHQLPVGLFRDVVSKDTHYTTGKHSCIDIWAVKNGELFIFELKKPNNNPLGIISELMLYVNIIDDILRHQIQYIPYKVTPKALKNDYRGFKEFYDLYTSGTIKKINAVFLAETLHPLLTKDVIATINDSARLKYSHIEFSYQPIGEL